MARSPRGVTFFACAKKVTKESTPQAARPALRSGSASGPGIFVRHIHVPYENAVIHDGALRVLPGPLAVPHGDPKAINSKAAASDLSGVALGAPEVRQSRRVKPAGRRTRMCGVFGRGRMPRPKIPAGTAHPARSGGRTAGGCFFCLLFFARAKRCFSTAEWLVKGRPRGERHHGSETETSLARPPKVGAITDVVTARTNTRTWLDLSPAPLSHRDFLRAPQEEGLDRVPLKPG